MTNREDEILFDMVADHGIKSVLAALVEIAYDNAADSENALDNSAWDNVGNEINYIVETVELPDIE